MVKELPLKNGYVALIDDEDFERLGKYKWTFQKGKNTYYAARNDYSSGKRVYQYLHRAVLEIEDTSVMIDHINGDGFDNRKENLRPANNSQNQANKRQAKHSTQKYKGVRRRRTLQDKYDARITYLGKEIYLGRFETAEEAALAYDLKSLEIYGEFAKTNFTKEEIHEYSKSFEGIT